MNDDERRPWPTRDIRTLQAMVHALTIGERLAGGVVCPAFVIIQERTLHEPLWRHTALGELIPMDEVEAALQDDTWKNLTRCDDCEASYQRSLRQQDEDGEAKRA